jgi:phytoene desaturase
MLLARAGLDVTVLERGKTVGGRTSTITSSEGFKFDLGPTFFLYPQVLRGIFAMCGRSLDREVELIRLDPNYRLAFENGDHIDAVSDVAALRREIERVAPRDARNVDRYIEDNRGKLEAFKPILESSFESLGDVMRLPLLRLLRQMRPWRSVDADLRSFFSDPRIRLAFSFQSKYLGMSPFRCPSLFTILAFLEYEYGVFHPRGGCGAVTEAMARVATDLGAKIRLDEPVEEILFEGRRAVGVRTARGALSCDALVVNADFAHAMSRLVPDALRRRWTDRKLARKRYSCSTYMMYLGLEGRCDDLAHHTIFLTDEYKRNLHDIETAHRLSENPSFYVQNACVTDSSLAPPGMTSLYVLVPVTHQHRNVDWNLERDRFRERTLRQLTKVGLNDVERRIRFEKVITPQDWESDLHVYRGATFNLAHSLDQMLHLRPNNRFEDLDGVYLVGGGTHPGSGLPVIFESAKISSRLLAEDLDVVPDWDAASELALPGREAALAETMATVA